MADLTVYAEALIATVARAFYDDDAVCLIDVMIRDKFLRDDDMAKRLQLPAKRLRATLQFLTEENLVRHEDVNDLAQGGSQATKFYYLDYNRAVHSIRLRVHMLKVKLEKAEMDSRSSSFYLCPGYEKSRCNGRYTEEEAQRVLDMTSGRFLCQECSVLYENDPQPPPQDEYTLKLVDNEMDLKLAMDNIRHLNVQLSGKSIGNHQLRAGVYELLQKVRGKGKAPITSNLPSENFALGIGSTRIIGTGRTMAMKVKKMKNEGLASSAAQARAYLVGGRAPSGANGGDLMFLKSAHGHEIQLTVERGAGSRAQLLAKQKLRTRKLMDAAASRVGSSLPIPLRVVEGLKRKAAAEAAAAATKDPKKAKAPIGLEFLHDNIGRSAHERTTAENVDDWDAETDVADGEEETENRPTNGEPDLVLADEMEAWVQMPEESRIMTFQAQYKLEMTRQEGLLQLDDGSVSPIRLDMAEEGLAWEDGDLN
jgi:transcription initiation factor TFIIE subunit alpha